MTSTNTNSSSSAYTGDQWHAQSTKERHRRLGFAVRGRAYWVIGRIGAGGRYVHVFGSHYGVRLDPGDPTDLSVAIDGGGAIVFTREADARACYAAMEENMIGKATGTVVQAVWHGSTSWTIAP